MQNGETGRWMERVRNDDGSGQCKEMLQYGKAIVWEYEIVFHCFFQKGSNTHRTQTFRRCNEGIHNSKSPFISVPQLPGSLLEDQVVLSFL